MVGTTLPWQTLAALLQERSNTLVLGCQFTGLETMRREMAGRMAVVVIVKDAVEKSRCYSWLSRSPWQEYSFRCVAMETAQDTKKESLPKLDVTCISNAGDFPVVWVQRLQQQISGERGIVILLRGSVTELAAYGAGNSLKTKDAGWIGVHLQGTRLARGNRKQTGVFIETMVEEVDL